MTDLHAADQQARRVAQSVFDRPLVLDAGAGTGKTSTLVARIAVWCLGRGWIKAEAALRQAGRQPNAEAIAARVLERIVAITFTEAAAAEMAARVAEALTGLERGELPDGILDECLPPAHDERRTRAHAFVATLDHLAVRTIHAYCRRLLASYPLEAGVHPSFQVDADQSLQAEVVREVLDETLQQAYDEPGNPDLLKLAGWGFGPTEIEAAVAAMLDAGLPAAAFEADPFAAQPVEQFAARLRGLLEDFETATDSRLRDLKKSKNGLAVIAAVAASLTDLQTLPRGRDDLAKLIESLQQTWNDTALGRLRDWSNGKFNAEESTCLGSASTAVATNAASLSRTIAHTLNLDLDRLDSGRRAVGPLLEQVRTQLRNRGIATFSSLLRGARDLVASHPDIAERVRSGMDQLLVDEFQDTDAIQCDLIRILALAGKRNERPALFVVGDPKQSIYGWRNADLRAYDQFVGEIENADGLVQRLSINFRSVPAILEEVERVIEPILQREEGLQPAFQSLQASPQHAAETGFTQPGFAPIEYWVSWDGTATGATKGHGATEVEATALARNLADLHHQHGVPWREVGILMRSTGDLETYCLALREAGVPYAVQRDRSYFLRREVIEAAALVQCILDAADHLALLTVLRSPLVGVPDAALLPLWARNFPGLMTELHAPAPAQLQQLEGITRDAAAHTPKVPGIERVHGWEHALSSAVANIASLRESFRSDPSDVFIEKLRAWFLLEPTEAARHLGLYRIANLDRFFQRLLAALEMASGDAHAVLRALRLSVRERLAEQEGRPQESGEDAVQIMTIHAAKGLAFAHVYLLQLHKQTSRFTFTMNEAAEVPGGVEYRLFGTTSLGFDSVLAYRARVESAEMVRTLYVAMTRARVRLVLVGNWPTKDEPARPKAHIDLLHTRRIAAVDLAKLAEDCAKDTRTPHADSVAARWAFPGLSLQSKADNQHDAGAAGAMPRLTIEPAAVAAAAEVLQRHRFDATHRMGRRFSGAVSAQAHDELAELMAQRFDNAGSDAPSTPQTMARSSVADAGERIALAAGTAVHRVMETFALEADPQHELAAQQRLIEQRLPASLSNHDRDEVCRRAADILARFAAGPLWKHFVQIGAHVVARELPVLLAPTDDGEAVGFLSGAIDMVYRDPADGELVIVDYKTDAVVSEDDIDARARVYESQGRLYAHALQEALALPRAPRVELWFLHAGERR